MSDAKPNGHRQMNGRFAPVVYGYTTGKPETKSVEVLDVVQTANEGCFELFHDGRLLYAGKFTDRITFDGDRELAAHDIQLHYRTLNGELYKFSVDSDGVHEMDDEDKETNQ